MGEAINKGKRRHFGSEIAASLGFIIPGIFGIGNPSFARESLSYLV